MAENRYRYSGILKRAPSKAWGNLPSISGEDAEIKIPTSFDAMNSQEWKKSRFT
jgi:hypothetical protein